MVDDQPPAGASVPLVPSLQKSLCLLGITPTRVRELFGHTNPKTTEIYTDVCSIPLSHVVSPLDIAKSGVYLSTGYAHLVHISGMLDATSQTQFMKTRKSSFYPFADLTKKSNYKQYKIVERDGTILERVFLNIPIPELREKLICMHYLSRRVKLFTKELIGFNIVSRDNPWDFKIDFSNGELFNVEITSIAEDSYIFEKLKREERLMLTEHKEKIEFHELKKLNYFFPSKEIDTLIQSLEEKNISKNDLISNPWNEKTHLTIGKIYEDRPELSELIKTAIEKKEKKKHSYKSSTVLLIDNRTFMYEIEHLNAARDELDDLFQQSSFAEIWFYTGYYSSLDSNDAEFNLAPLKITSEQEQKLIEYSQQNPPNEDGLTFA